MSHTHFTPAHQVRLFQGAGDLFEAVVQAIDDSVHEVRLETYVFHFDAQGERVAQALVRAARRGVAVFVVVDGIGTPALPAQWSQLFDHSGVQWHRFSPLGCLGVLFPVRWRRLHRKLCVVDGKQAFCGGINVIDDFVDLHHGQLSAPRLDFSVQVGGPLVKDVQAVMEQFWLRLAFARNVESLQWKAARAQLRQPTLTTTVHTSVPAKLIPSTANKAVNSAVSAALLLRDNVHHRTRIEQAYRKAIGEARSEVLIANAYFVPGRKLRHALVHAAQRGVRVRLLLQGQYEYFMQYHGARAVYGVLLAAGVEIYEYKAGFLHAKVAVVDRRWATVGSSNLDPLSLLLAREANVVVHDRRFALLLRERVLSALNSKSTRVQAQAYAGRGWWQRAMDILALGLMRIILFLIGRPY